jgi:hypothetical protein
MHRPSKSGSELSMFDLLLRQNTTEQKTKKRTSVSRAGDLPIWFQNRDDQEIR